MPTMLILIIFVAGMMFFTQRNQKKKANERQNQLNSLAKGDEIVTIGGLYGLIDEVDVDNKKMTLDVDGVFLTFELSALKRVVAKATVQTEVVSDVASETSDVTEKIIEESSEVVTDEQTEG
ncbi:preprotein translocase subunit YajC [Streptococcus saliviloxodontae]|uniref:Preprotein translocase subunit YajC n=2 Tax=Streptococcus saliviloxodontae TaxID=1349416 RepID=A0ABS2PLN7_9STRE|nr:preprotein translocase subunit YajC [Streptococcus saliviloxodontae]MBM7636281.1 preprotein translocase subunit YajC [Streptococcus saliviloxodontae]